jgi:hypothetical protein
LGRKVTLAHKVHRATQVTLVRKGHKVTLDHKGLVPQ